ncbi:hypothetical protein FOZ62_003015 [Perkinsus olseni]|uniref:Uncharacterized protein n=1 Tax=Perkinsus olseni TaxID=32597 RepID=A0A7J6RQ57_PEROL|nr:hypothetical protein FOZ62_003015 [Perkinsus olseni]
MLLLCIPARAIVVAAAVTTYTLLFAPRMTRAFPPLSKTRLVVEGYGADCYYSDGVLAQGRGHKLDVKVGRARGLQTVNILCPRTDDRPEFHSEFSWPANVLKSYHLSFPSPSPDHLITFQEPPLNGTGLDPLRNIRGLALDNKLANLNSTASQMMPFLPPPLWLYLTEETMARTGTLEGCCVLVLVVDRENTTTLLWNKWKYVDCAPSVVLGDHPSVVSPIGHASIEAMGVIEGELGMTAKETIMNQNFWGRPFSTLESMAREEDPKVIAQIVSNCELMHRRSIPLFTQLKGTLLRTLPQWRMHELATVVKGWRELGFLTPDLMLSMLPYITDNIHSMTSSDIVTFLDAFATIRLTVEPQPLVEAAAGRIEEFAPLQLVSICSSLARLNVMMVVGKVVIIGVISYSFANLRAMLNPSLWPTLMSLFHHTLDGMVAAHLTMCVTAFSRVDVRLTPSVASAVNRRAMQVMAEFSATGMAMFLRDVEIVSESLVSRVAMHLPRLLESATAEDVAVLVKEGLLTAASSRPCPLAILDVLRPYIIQFAGSFTDAQRLDILNSLMHHYGREESVEEISGIFSSVRHWSPVSMNQFTFERTIAVDEDDVTDAVARSPLMA